MKMVALIWDAIRRINISAANYRGLAYRRFLQATGRVRFGERVSLRGIPLIDIRADAQLDVGAGTQLNSLNLGYHLNMGNRVKLMADRPGATIRIGRDCRIHGACIHAQESVVVGDRCLIATGCQIMDGSGHDLSAASPEMRLYERGSTKPVVIEDDVWLAAGVIVLPGVRIGRGSVVSAGSVVRKDIPPMTLAGGVPCDVIKSLTELRADTKLQRLEPTDT